MPPERPHGRGGLSLACRLLPPRQRRDVEMLYAVFRRLDDAVDDGEPGAADRVAAVEAWCRTGAVGSPEAAALAAVDGRRALPREALLDFCAGMRHDLEGAAIRTEADLDRYCYRVAGTVGRCVAAVLGTRAAHAEPAARLGIALQRTNVLRDIDEDLAAGRVYVPAETLAAHGGSLLPGRREALLRDEIARADAHYEAGLIGVSALRRGRWAVAAAAFMYREVLRQLEREGLGPRPGRAVVPAWRRALAAVRGGVWLLGQRRRPVARRALVGATGVART